MNILSPSYFFIICTVLFLLDGCYVCECVDMSLAFFPSPSNTLLFINHISHINTDRLSAISIRPHYMHIRYINHINTDILLQHRIGYMCQSKSSMCVRRQFFIVQISVYPSHVFNITNQCVVFTVKPM